MYRKKIPNTIVSVKFEEHRYAVVRGIAFLIFHTNVSKCSHKLQPDFTDK